MVLNISLKNYLKSRNFEYCCLTKWNLNRIWKLTLFFLCFCFCNIWTNIWTVYWFTSSLDVNKNQKIINSLIWIWLAYRNSWTLDARVGRWTLDAGLLTLGPGLWTLDSERWTLDSGHWTLDFGRWFLDPGHCRWLL